MSGFEKAVQKLRKEYTYAQGTGNTQQFIFDKTQRPLPSINDTRKSLNRGYRKLSTTPVRSIDNTATFIQERYDRVKQVFFDITGQPPGEKLIKDK